MVITGSKNVAAEFDRSSSVTLDGASQPLISAPGFRWDSKGFPASLTSPSSSIRDTPCIVP